MTEITRKNTAYAAEGYLVLGDLRALVDASWEFDDSASVFAGLEDRGEDPERFDLLAVEGLLDAAAMLRDESTPTPSVATKTGDQEKFEQLRIDRILDRVRQHRRRQIEKGYTAQHDDEHGLKHILDQARVRIDTAAVQEFDDAALQEKFEEAAAVLIAASEWMERHA